MDTEHTTKIRDNYLFLLDTIDTSSELLGYLFASNVIDFREKDEISYSGGTLRQNETLLSIISKKSSDDFELFLRALRNTGQEHVARVFSADLAGVLHGDDSKLFQSVLVFRYRYRF